MSHDIHAAWATTEIASLYRQNPMTCFLSPPDPATFSVSATREGKRIWPISDGVINIELDSSEKYNIAIEFKRRNEGLHGVLTAIGQSHAYLHKGYSGSVIIIPNSYDSHESPGKHVADILNMHSSNLPIGLYTYEDPDSSKTSPFSGKLQCIKGLELDTYVSTPTCQVSKGVQTQWGHAREGSCDLNSFYLYLKAAKQLSANMASSPFLLPQELIDACNNIKSNCDPLEYLSNATGDTLHDEVWRVFWFTNVFHSDAIPIWISHTTEYLVNETSSKIMRSNGEYKKFFVGRSDSIKNKLIVMLNDNSISEEDAWIKYAKNVHERAHSFREDIDSTLSALGLLEDDGRPSELGYKFVDSVERSNSCTTGTPRAIILAALLKNANFGALLHYIHRLSEDKFKQEALCFTEIDTKGNLRFNKNEYLLWLKEKLSNDLGVMRTVSRRSGNARPPLQGELAFMRAFNIVESFRIGVGLEIDWSAVQQGLEFDI